MELEIYSKGLIFITCENIVTCRRHAVFNYFIARVKSQYL